MKIYNDKNVYEATQERLQFIFEEFNHIYVSFSGGKDSGLLLNLVLDYKKKHGYTNKIGLFHEDFEAQYTKTTEYVERTFKNNMEDIDPYWVCLPIASKTPVSNYQMYWYPWDPNKKDCWCREMPKHDYIINLDNNPFDFYKEKMLQEKLYDEFGYWYAKQKGEKVICLVGCRSAESLNRFRAVNNKVHDYKGQKWMTDHGNNYYSAFPIYDWEVDDVWIANAKFGYDYNELYDLYYKAGLKVSEMRVASPFNEWAVEALQVYRIIDPAIWCKLLGRIEGANFANIYGKTKALGRKNITLPEGHTWKSYTEFLLSTLPEDVAANYLDKFTTSIKFWTTKGGGLPVEAIEEIERLGYRVKRNGISPWSKNKHECLVFEGEIPDETDDVTTTIDIPSWKRMCICILKNDHNCKSMGFGPTAEQQKNIDEIKKKYKAVAFGGKKNE